MPEELLFTPQVSAEQNIHWGATSQGDSSAGAAAHDGAQMTITNCRMVWKV